MTPLTQARYAGCSEGVARFALKSGWECRIVALEPYLFRVLFVRDAAVKESRTWAIAPWGSEAAWEGRDRLDVHDFSQPIVAVAEHDNEVTISIGDIVVSVDLHPFAIRWIRQGRAFARDRASDAYQFSERAEIIRHAMARETGDRYYGLGDKTGPLNHHGRRVRTLALDALGYDAETSDPLYKHWPFVICQDAASGIAYGLYYDTLAPCTFDLGCEHDNYHGLYRYAEIDDGDLDYYVLVGPRVRDVVRGFTELTGRMAFGPRWSLGYANTAMSLTDAPDAQARLAGVIEDAARYDIPMSAFHFGSGYTSIGKRRYVFTWNRNKFPDPQASVAKFAASNIRVCVNLKPCLLDDHPAFDVVAAQGAFVSDARTGAPCLGQFWDGRGAHIDFTHREGIRWWQQGLRREVLGVGIDSGWNDNNEYEIWDEDAHSNGFGKAIQIARSRPLHALLMTRATAEEQSAYRPEERVFTVTRAGPPGIQRYAQTWSGDNSTSWHTLRWNIRMGLTMGLSGLFNTGHDVGGFSGPVPDPELLLRWTQNGVFWPRFIMNSWKAGGEVNTPWLHPQVLAGIRDAIRLRYRLMPYLYTLYWRAATLGEPIVRPLFYEFDDDLQSYADRDDFMLGAQLMVASVVEPDARTRRVYLPQGPAGWFEFDTGISHGPGGEIVVDAPLERVPMFVPAGAMIPLTAGDDFSRLHDEPSRRLRIFPGEGSQRSAFTLYEDDGISLRYRHGDYSEVAFEMESSPSEIHLSARVAGTYRLPYDTIEIEPLPTEGRRVLLSGHGIDLALIS